MSQLLAPVFAPVGTSQGLPSEEALGLRNRVNLGIASQIVQDLAHERTRLVSGVSREWNISLFSGMLIVSLAPFSPIFSLFVVPALVYGVYTYLSDRRRLKQISAALRLVRKIAPLIAEQAIFSQ